MIRMRIRVGFRFRVAFISRVRDAMAVTMAESLVVHPEYAIVLNSSVHEKKVAFRRAMKPGASFADGLGNDEQLLFVHLRFTCSLSVLDIFASQLSYPVVGHRRHSIPRYTTLRASDYKAAWNLGKGDNLSCEP